MNNLTTRKIVLGLLMTLVLAFSVQGIADAFEVTKSTNSVALLPISGTTSEQTFSFGITFTTTEVGADLVLADDDNKGVTTVTLSATNATITSFKVGNLADDNTDNNPNTAVVDAASTSSYTVTVKYTLAVVGERNFEVDGTRVYTAYGVQRPDQVQGLGFAVDADNPEVEIGYANPNNEFYLDQNVSVDVGNESNVVVEFERVWGSGQLYEDLDDVSTQLDPGRSLTTRANGVTDNGVATVRLRMGRGSTIIRASIRGANLARAGDNAHRHLFLWRYYPKEGFW